MSHAWTHVTRSTCTPSSPSSPTLVPSTGGHILDPLRRSTTSSIAWHFSWTTSSHIVRSPTGSSTTRLLMTKRKTQRKASRRHKKRTSMTNNFELCWLHHCTFRSEKQVQNAHNFITRNEKAWCPVHLKIRSLSVQSRLTLDQFPREANLLMLFLGVRNRFSDSLTRKCCEISSWWKWRSLAHSSEIGTHEARTQSGIS